MKPLLSVEELAGLLKVPTGTIYAWRSRRLGPPGVRVGRYVRFKVEDVEEWIEAQRDRHMR